MTIGTIILIALGAFVILWAIIATARYLYCKYENSSFYDLSESIPESIVNAFPQAIEVVVVLIVLFIVGFVLFLVWNIKIF